MGKFTFSAILALSVCLSACVKQPAHSPDDALPERVASIIVLPVVAAPDTKEKNQQQIKELNTGIEVLTQILEETFVTNDAVRMIGPEVVDSMQGNYSAGRSAQSMSIAKTLDAEAFMLWDLKRYHERQGTNYAVVSPASVAFEYRLIHTETGKTLCWGAYDETQQSATENLLSLKKLAARGFKWIGASSLTREGVAKKISECRYLK